LFLCCNTLCKRGALMSEGNLVNVWVQVCSQWGLLLSATDPGTAGAAEQVPNKPPVIASMFIRHARVKPASTIEVLDTDRKAPTDRPYGHVSAGHATGIHGAN